MLDGISFQNTSNMQENIMLSSVQSQNVGIFLQRRHFTDSDFTYFASFFVTHRHFTLIMCTLLGLYINLELNALSVRCVHVLFHFLWQFHEK